ncbi:hypothetical protein WA026_000827, partial [Henosepilachna vigintioctopunctata]
MLLGPVADSDEGERDPPQTSHSIQYLIANGHSVTLDNFLDNLTQLANFSASKYELIDPRGVKKARKIDCKVVQDRA